MVKVLWKSDNTVNDIGSGVQILDVDGDVIIEGVQLFFKRLRKQLSPNPLRFFQCGEYGEETFRPHHHVVLPG